MTQEQIDTIYKCSREAIKAERDYYGDDSTEISDAEAYAEVIKALSYQQRHFDKYNKKKPNSFANRKGGK